MKLAVGDAKRKAVSMTRTLLRRVFPDRVQTVWRGYYRAFAAVPLEGPGYDGDEWLTASTATARELLANAAAAPQRTEHALLSLLIATRFRGTRVRILDIGGGVGVSYLHLKASAPDAVIEYQVVERERIAREATAILGKREDVRFCSSLDEVTRPLDVVYLSAVLQYIEDYREYLRAIAALAPQIILLANTNVGAAATYASAQTNVRGSVIPCWFFNRDELVTCLADLGYKLTFQAVDTRNYEQEDVPPELVVRHPMHLLFERSP